MIYAGPTYRAQTSIIQARHISLLEWNTWAVKVSSDLCPNKNIIRGRRGLLYTCIHTARLCCVSENTVALGHRHRYLIIKHISNSSASIVCCWEASITESFAMALDQGDFNVAVYPVHTPYRRQSWGFGGATTPDFLASITTAGVAKY